MKTVTLKIAGFKVITPRTLVDNALQLNAPSRNYSMFSNKHDFITDLSLILKSFSKKDL
jgi:hypothetical protein